MTDLDLIRAYHARRDAWASMAANVPLGRMSPEDRGRAEELSRQFRGAGAAIVEGLRERGGLFEFEDRRLMLNRDGDGYIRFARRGPRSVEEWKSARDAGRAAGGEG